jgi:hypothetical protein
LTNFCGSVVRKILPISSSDEKHSHFAATAGMNGWVQLREVTTLQRST